MANARHSKAVPGRKTDVKDAAWLADLLKHGLLRPSFIPARPQGELRELVRYRRRLIQEKTQLASRLQQVLEGGNIKLASVASDILGVSRRAMLAGEEDPDRLAAFAHGVFGRSRRPCGGRCRAPWGPISGSCWRPNSGCWRRSRRRWRTWRQR